ncbi:hypothetical protein DDJ66_21015 [Klebsiella oxytoca]|nr:hypothetical protein DDJ34_21450 [Klebsiella oxytoca]RFP47154.1 hypothetical protein DDJ66_21015 [Klebsiella oxytoca]RFP49543.1 hypothetical protein DDJ69_19095 [Klebsiella oxytoca]
MLFTYFSIYPYLNVFCTKNAPNMVIYCAKSFMPSLNKKRPAIRRSRASFALLCSGIVGYAAFSAIIPDIPPLRWGEKTLLFVIFLDLLNDVGRRTAVFEVEH